MKIIVIMLSLFLGAQTFAVTSAKQNRALKNKTAKAVSQKRVTSRTTTRLVRTLPAKKVTTQKYDPNYSPYYPYTDSTKASNGSLGILNRQESRTDLTPVVAIEEPKKWYIKFDSENMKNITDINPGGYNGDVSAFQTLSYGYKITDLATVQISQDWTQLYGYGTTDEGKANARDNSMEDLNFRFTYGSLFHTDKSNLAGQVRYYAPSSDNSQLAGQIGQLRLYLIGEYQFTPQWAAGLIFSPRYFMQKANAYENQEGEIKNNNNWRLLQSAGLKFSPTDWFALETTIGVYSKKKYNESMKHFQDYGTSFYLNIGSNFTVNAGIRASDGAYDTRAEGGFSPYNIDYSEYFAILTLKI